MKDFDKLDFIAFKQKYENIMLDPIKRLKYCPKKTSIHLLQENNMDIKYLNTMPAMTDQGCFIKSIYIDLSSSKNTIEEIIYIRDGKTIKTTNLGLTPYRCGMMACLILSYIPNINKVGFIGTGNINKHIAKMIKKWIPYIKNFGIISRHNFDEDLNYFNEILPTDHALFNCDVIFSCTNNSSMDFYDDYNYTKCLVALDGGNIFSPLTRFNRDFYSDHVEQIEEVYENEFPFDNYKPINIKQLDSTIKNTKTFINLYGIAYADAILFEQLIDKEDFN